LKTLIKSAGSFLPPFNQCTSFFHQSIPLFLIGWTDVKGMFVVYPLPEFAAKCKEFLPKYQAWKYVEEASCVCSARELHGLCTYCRIAVFICICFEQLEMKNGATTEELMTNKYFDAEAIHFIEKVCIFATLDAQHRFVVRVLA